MTNLRILKKRDGSQVFQEYVPYALTGEQMGQAGTRWQDIPILEEPEPEKSLAQVLFEVFDWGKGLSPYYSHWDMLTDQANEIEKYLLSKGWRKPE